MEQEGPSSGALYQPGREGRNTFPGSPEAGDSPAPIPEVEVLGTPLGAIEPQRLMAYCQSRSRRPGPFALDFTNTHIVAMRRRSREFRRLTGCFDGFLPDGMPLVWCMKRAAPAHRVYGPSFMGMCLELSAPGYRHFFLGGSEECLARLEARAAGANPGFRLAGSQHGYFPEEEAESIVDRINGLSPDFLWVGLGTPRQQQWIARWKSRILRGVILAGGLRLRRQRRDQARRPSLDAAAGPGLAPPLEVGAQAADRPLPLLQQPLPGLPASGRPAGPGQ